MISLRKSALGGGLSLAVLGVGAAVLLTAPERGLALGAGDPSAVSLSALGSFASFTPASVDPRLAALVAERSSDRGRLMRFTPAGSSSRPDRRVTVAVRVDSQTAQAISVRSAMASARDGVASSEVRVAPTRYNLGLAREYQTFAKPPTLAKSLGDVALPDLASYRPAPEPKGKPSRFSARIELEETINTGREPRTREALGDQSVGVGGSFSMTRNLDVTAGVRYSQDRDRIAPIDQGKQDSKAVYVGTQFRF